MEKKGKKKEKKTHLTSIKSKPKIHLKPFTSPFTSTPVWVLDVVTRKYSKSKQFESAIRSPGQLFPAALLS